MQPLPGDFGLVNIGGEVGRLIRFGQFLNGDGYSTFEHAFIYLGNDLIVEAEPGGARIDALGLKYSSLCWSTGHFNLSTAQRNAICTRARAFTTVNNGKGAPYSFLDYGALFAHRLRLPIPGLQGFIEDSGHVICSQLVDICYQNAGVKLFTDGRWPGYVTPGALYTRLGCK